MPKYFVQLGRYGDIINILPILRAESETAGEPIPLAVHESYADLLDGASYVSPRAWRGEAGDVLGAAKFFDGTAIITQAWGNRAFKRECGSYLKESWRLAGRLADWNKLPLVFDRRDATREAALVGSLKLDGRPLVLSVAASGSSPLKGAANFLKSLAESLPSAQFVSLDDVKAERIYDLLGAFERAALLVSIDTAPLQLSYATKTSTLALVNDEPTMWHGSTVRSHWIGSIRYRQIRDPKEVARAVEMIHAHIPLELDKWSSRT